MQPNIEILISLGEYDSEQFVLNSAEGWMKRDPSVSHVVNKSPEKSPGIFL